MANNRNSAFAVLYPTNNYDGQTEYTKSLPSSDKWGKTRQVIKDGLADVLTFGMGAMADLYSPAGIAYGMKAVSNRHSAINNARNEYRNALNNNLNQYDYLTNQVRVPLPFSRDEVTGNTDFSPYTNKVLLDQVRDNYTAEHYPDMYNAGTGLAASTYNKYGNGSASTNKPGIQPLQLEVNNNQGAGNSNIQNVNNYNGTYGTFGNAPLSGGVSKTTGFDSYPVNLDFLEKAINAGRTDVKNAKDDKYKYYNTDSHVQVARENNIRSTNASIENSKRSAGVSRQNALDRLAFEKERNNAEQNEQSELALDLADFVELSESGDANKLNEFRYAFIKKYGKDPYSLYNTKLQR